MLCYSPGEGVHDVLCYSRGEGVHDVLCYSPGEGVHDVVLQLCYVKGLMWVFILLCYRPSVLAVFPRVAG
jgi:hypothetical protein